MRDELAAQGLLVLSPEWGLEALGEGRYLRVQVGREALPELLAQPEKRDELIEHLVVGAMSVEQALPRIRRIPGTKAVITGGDRADMQLVALETATKCLVLTGHLRPVPEVLRRAEEVGEDLAGRRGGFDRVKSVGWVADLSHPLRLLRRHLPLRGRKELRGRMMGRKPSGAPATLRCDRHQIR